MAKTDGIFILAATYPDEAAAQEDYQVVKDLHAGGLVGSYDAAVVTKDAKGKVHENKDETATRHGAWWGVAVGAAVGLTFDQQRVAVGDQEKIVQELALRRQQAAIDGVTGRDCIDVVRHQPLQEFQPVFAGKPEQTATPQPHETVYFQIDELVDRVARPAAELGAQFLDAREQMLVRRVLDVLELLAVSEGRRVVGEFEVFCHRL